MTHRLSAALLATIVTLVVWSPDALALHPAPFPHKHVEEAAPRPAETRPRREPVRPRYLPTVYAGVGLIALGVIGDEDTGSLANGIEGGGGFELFVGWRLNPWAAVDIEWFTTFHETNYTGSNLETAMLGGLSGLVRVYILDPGEFEPYATLGLGLLLASAGQNSGGPLTGPVFSGGFGADLNLNHTITLGAKALYRGAFMDNRGGQLQGAPTEAAFLSMVSLSAHLRLNF